jgi:LmbE family N-acetylglucosaminyl deacetylase
MDFLDAISCGSRIDEPVALVLAHPDDETASAGALLQRLARPTLIYLTDGSPRDLQDARREGFGNWRDYAALRRRELGMALMALGVTAQAIHYDAPDKQAHEFLDSLVERLVRHLARLEAVVTHAYEHGHPDHDTAALAVALARRRLGPDAPSAFEFAGYHLGSDGAAYGRFWSGDGIELRPSEAEVERKRAAVTAYQSQRETLRLFPLAPERFRPAPGYDFGRSAPPGRALYDLYGWDITSDRWRSAVAEPVL